MLHLQYVTLNFCCVEQSQPINWEAAHSTEFYLLFTLAKVKVTIIRNNSLALLSESHSFHHVVLGLPHSSAQMHVSADMSQGEMKYTLLYFLICIDFL